MQCFFFRSHGQYNIFFTLSVRKWNLSFRAVARKLTLSILCAKNFVVFSSKKAQTTKGFDIRYRFIKKQQVIEYISVSILQSELTNNKNLEKIGFEMAKETEL